MPAALRIYVLLGFIAGFVDAATFTHLYGLFSAHVSANIVVLAAAAAAGPRQNDILKVLAFPIFVAAAAAAAMYYGRARAGDRDKTLLMATGGLLFAGGLVALLFAKASSGGYVSAGDALAGLIAVAAMGVKSALLGLKANAPVKIMAGGLTQLGLMAAHALSQNGDSEENGETGSLLPP